MARKKQLVNFLWFAVPDLLFMYASLHLALVYKYGASVSDQQVGLHYKIFTPLFLAWLAVLYVHNLFDPKTLRRYMLLAFSVLSAAAVSFLVAIVYFYFQPDLLLTPRRFLLVLAGSAFSLIFLWHLAIKMMLSSRFTEEYFLYSPNGELDDLHREMLTHSYLGFRVIQHLSDDALLAHLAPGSKVIVAEGIFSQPEKAKVIYGLRSRGADILGQIDFTERLLRRVPLAHVDESWLLRNIWARTSRLQDIATRTLDIAVGLAFSIAFIITFPFIALAIKIDSSGPVFFRQERVGRGLRTFQVLKYRTMSAESKSRGWTKINDSRITKVGKFLRRTHLDELPQFVNLLAGTMTVVGPRPEQAEIVAGLRSQIPFYDERHAIKPGLTGWSQLNIYAGTLEESRLKLEYDLYYLKHRSFLFDLEIMLKTLYSIFVNKLK